MDFIEEMKRLASRIDRQGSSVLTEQACKMAFVVPFIRALGYDETDPDVVVPELTADVGVKKGEKVDFAIKVDGKIAILIECKGFRANLAQVHHSQLFRYFTVTEARVGILTNGIEYWFYSDLDAPNRMDEKPFFMFNVLSHRADDVAQVQRFANGSFDLDAIVASASTLKYGSAIKAELLKEIESPTEEMIRLLVTRVVPTRFTQKVRDDFAPLVQAAFRDVVRERVNDRLTSALEATSTPPAITSVAAAAAEESAEEVVTTAEEYEGFHIIKAIIRNVVKADRVFLRDAKSYCAILLDDNNRKPLARLHFNAKSVWYLTLFDGEKEDKIRIDSLDDLYGYQDRLRATAASYDQAKVLTPV